MKGRLLKLLCLALGHKSVKYGLWQYDADGRKSRSHETEFHCYRCGAYTPTVTVVIL